MGPCVIVTLTICVPGEVPLMSRMVTVVGTVVGVDPSTCGYGEQDMESSGPRQVMFW